MHNWLNQETSNETLQGKTKHYKENGKNWKTPGANPSATHISPNPSRFLIKTTPQKKAIQGTQCLVSMWYEYNCLWLPVAVGLCEWNKDRGFLTMEHKVKLVPLFLLQLHICNCQVMEGCHIGIQARKSQVETGFLGHLWWPKDEKQKIGIVSPLALNSRGWGKNKI